MRAIGDTRAIGDRLQLFNGFAGEKLDSTIRSSFFETKSVSDREVIRRNGNGTR